MINNNSEIIKNAFIDVICESYYDEKHTFTLRFEKEIALLIKKQRHSYWKYINTVGKRIACACLVILFCFTAMFSVKALREPLVEAVKNFYVSVKQKLTGTQAYNIAENFTDDITQIVATNYITSNPKEYTIKDKQKIIDFSNLLSKTTWGIPLTKYDAITEYVYWKFEFKSQDKTVTTINMCGRTIESHGTVEIVTDENSKVYNVAEQIYLDILSFTTQKYYLHKSDLELPTGEKSVIAQKTIFEGLDDSEKLYVKAQLHYAHYRAEHLLLENVSTLKEPNSPYWYPAITGEQFTDPFSGAVYTNGIENSFNGVLEYLKNIADTLKNAEGKNSFITMYNDLMSACNNHDIGSIFTVHEYIHDYDYFAVNYPPHFKLQPADWSGLQVYFGHLN